MDFFATAVSSRRARLAVGPSKKWFPGHYLYAAGGIEPDGSRITQTVRSIMAAHPSFVGYKLHYFWGALETAFGVYDFSPVIADLDYAQSIGKKIQLMIWERRWNISSASPIPPVPYPLPTYMQTDPIYEGGAYYAYEANGNFSCFPKIWLAPIAERFAAFWAALGAAIDHHPALAAVLHDETVYVGITKQPGYTAQAFIDNQITVHTAAGSAFPNTIYIAYFSHHYGLTDAQVAAMINILVGGKYIGMGAPDVYRNDPPKHLHSPEFPYSTEFILYKGIIPMGSELQNECYDHNSARAAFDFAIDEAELHFMTWSPIQENPHGTKAFYFDPDVLNVLYEEDFRINTTPPSNLLSQE